MKLTFSTPASYSLPINFHCFVSVKKKKKNQDQHSLSDCFHQTKTIMKLDICTGSIQEVFSI